MQILASNDPVYLQLTKLAKAANVVVFVGLPGTGKSLFINQFYHIAQQEDKQIQVIQWDVLRKEFEKGELKNKFPSAEGQVHPGVRLSAGKWLLDYIKTWCSEHIKNPKKLLLIEAPLVGNRFSELCQLQADSTLEKYLSDLCVQFVMPVPTATVRQKIEADRIAQISETAKTWSGAKPSVMQQLWQDTLAIARDFKLTDQSDIGYHAGIYQSTYQHILRHRNIEILAIEKVYDIEILNEASLHSLENVILHASEVQLAVEATVNRYQDIAAMEMKIQEWQGVNG